MAQPPRPRTRDFAGNAGGFVEALRVWRGIPYRRLAERANASVRGRHRKTSENYLYRLCHGQATLRADAIDGIARALELTDAEVSFLRRSLRATRLELPADAGSRRDYRRALLDSLAGQGADLDARVIEAIVDPLVLAIYTLLARPRSAAALPRAVARATTDPAIGVPEVRAALARLERTGLSSAAAGDRVGQSEPGADLRVHLGGALSDDVKSRAMKLFYAALDEWGAAALHAVPRERRQFASQTFLVAPADVPAAAAELAAGFRAVVAQVRERYQSPQGETVLHAGLRVWPMLDPIANERKPRRAR